MERPPKKYVCEKCGYLGDTSEHEGCDYLAWTTGERLYIDQLEAEIESLREQVEKLKAELTSIDGALDDPRVNLTLTTSEIIWELKEQVEKLTKERDFWRDGCQKEKLSAIDWAGKHQAQLLDHETQLAALAEQNEKFRETLSRWRYQNLSYNWCCGNCGAVDGDEHKEGCALSLPDLASPVLNRIRAEAMEEAAKIANEHEGVAWAVSAIRNRKAELEKTNG